MDLYQDDPTSLPAKAQGIRMIASALGVTLTVNQFAIGVDAIVEVTDSEGNTVPLYPEDTK